MSDLVRIIYDSQVPLASRTWRETLSCICLFKCSPHAYVRLPIFVLRSRCKNSERYSELKKQPDLRRDQPQSRIGTTHRLSDKRHLHLEVLMTLVVRGVVLIRDEDDRVPVDNTRHYIIPVWEDNGRRPGDRTLAGNTPLACSEHFPCHTRRPNLAHFWEILTSMSQLRA